MDKEDEVHIYSRILLSHEKQPNQVICRDVGRSRDVDAEKGCVDTGRRGRGVK